MSAVIKIIGQEAAFCDALKSALVAVGYEVVIVPVEAAADSILPLPDLTVLVVFAMGSQPYLGASMPKLESPFVVIAKEYSEAAGRKAVETGALAYLVRPAEPRACVPTIAAAIGRVEEIRRGAEEIRQLREKETNLSTALKQNRATSIAVGVLMERLRVDRNRALEALRDSARNRRCKMADLAEELLGAVERINCLG